MTAEHGVIPTLLPPSFSSSRGAFTDASQRASEREAAWLPSHATQIGTGNDCQLWGEITTSLENKRKCDVKEDVWEDMRMEGVA